jgi:hydrogenase-4 component J
MSERVVFYQLTHKFVNKEQNIPEDAKQVVYYSLAIGHHVGVMDCFQSLMEIPLDDYRQWIEHLPEGTARRKMEGVLKWGEIEVNKEHAGELLPLLNEPWTKPLAQSLQAMKKEPALYLMIRKMT